MVLMGDSRIRQIYQGIVRTLLNPEQGPLPYNFEDKILDDMAFNTNLVQINFIWAPTPKIMAKKILGKGLRRADVVIMGSGLHTMREAGYGGGENALKSFTKGMEILTKVT